MSDQGFRYLTQAHDTMISTLIQRIKQSKRYPSPLPQKQQDKIKRLKQQKFHI